MRLAAIASWWTAQVKWRSISKSPRLNVGKQARKTCGPQSFANSHVLVVRRVPRKHNVLQCNIINDRTVSCSGISRPFNSFPNALRAGAHQTLTTCAHGNHALRRASSLHAQGTVCSYRLPRI